MAAGVAFFPPNISVLVNLVTRLSLNLGSGMIRRLGTSRRRGMGTRCLSFFLRSGGKQGSPQSWFKRGSGLGPLHAVLRALAVTVDLVRRRRADCSRGVQRPSDDVVADARKIFDAATANEHDRVLLKVVAFAGNV